MRKTTVRKRMLAGVLSAVLTVTALPLASLTTPQKEVKAASVTLQNPRIVKDDSMQAGQKVTWDCIWFGSYPQREVVADAASYDAIDKGYYNPRTDVIEDEKLYQKLERISGWDSKNEIVIDGDKYRRIRKQDATNTEYNNSYYSWYQWDKVEWHYFKYDPVKWRVLGKNNDEIFVLSEKSLDSQPYNWTYSGVEWEQCTIRSWLNGYAGDKNQDNKDYQNRGFLNNAFEQNEISAIYANERNYMDRITLLSSKEAVNESYGFSNEHDQVRESLSSTYAKAMGICTHGVNDGGCNGGTCWYWLRDGGRGIHEHGYITGDPVNYAYRGVRPTMILKLSASNLWRYAGTVCSDGTMDEKNSDSSFLYTGAIKSDAYGVTEKERTRAGKVQSAAREFAKTANDYYNTIKNEAKTDYRNVQSVENVYKQLRSYDETASERKTSRLLTFDANTPDGAIDDAYEVLYDLLKECMQTGVEENLIKLDIDNTESIVEIEAKVINKILDSVKQSTGNIKGTGKNGYIVKLKWTGIFFQRFGSVEITKSGQSYVSYKGAFCSDNKTVSAAMTQFIADLSEETKKMYKEFALSFWQYFLDESQIGNVVADTVEEELKDHMDYLLQKGYGKLATVIVDVKKGYDVIHGVISAKTPGKLIEELKDEKVRDMYKGITKLRYTDPQLKKEAVKKAMEMLEKSRKALESVLFDYMCNEDTYDDMGWADKLQYFWKNYIQCPVNVEVYDNTGKLLGSVIDGVVFYNPSIYIELNGDVKTVYVPENIAVTFRLTGTDEGYMNYVTEKYENGEAVGRKNYYNIPLSKGIQYEQIVTSANNVANIQTDPLIQTNGNRIFATECVDATDKTANVEITGNVEDGGAILGSGTYAKGDSVELTEVAEKGYRFDGWYENDMLVSYEPNYRFTALKDRTITAKFLKEIKIPEQYNVYMSEKYKDSASVHMCDSEDGKTDIILSMYELEEKESVIVKTVKYDKKNNIISRKEEQAAGDGRFRYTLKDYDLGQMGSLTLSDESGELIATIKTKSDVTTPIESENKTQPNHIPKIGDKIRTKTAVYRITKTGTAANNTVTLERPIKKTYRTFNVPSTIKSTDGKYTFKVTGISKNAFKKKTKLKKVVLGKNVKTIGANAFAGCKNLKTIRIASTSLTKKSVGKNVFKGIHKKAVIKVPKKKLKAYRKFLKGKGQAKSVKIKKWGVV